MKIEIGRLFALSQRTAQMFRSIEPRPWTIRAICVELVAEYGSLAHCVMDAGGYKLTSRFDPAEAEDECSDVAFILMRLLDESGGAPDPDETLFVEAPDGAESIESLLLAVVRPLDLILSAAGNPRVADPVFESTLAVARLAHRLGLRPLETVHEQIMDDTQLWIRHRRLGIPLLRSVRARLRFVKPLVRHVTRLRKALR